MSESPKPGWLSFTIRDLMWLTVVVALVMALIYVKWPSGQGRYQMTSGGSKTFFLDTTTGKIWAQYSDNGDWHEYPSPSYGK